MELYIGGYKQGKLNYVLTKHKIAENEVLDEKKWNESINNNKSYILINHFHLYIKKLLEEGKDPYLEVEEIWKQNPNVILIADEIGCGIVPIKREERIYRETVGRILCMAAKRAELVERIMCGIGQRIK